MTTTAISSPLLATTPTAPGAATATAATSDREQLASVAKQFEAIFLRQMLSAARQTKFGEALLSGGQAMDTFRQMQDDHFADVAAGNGAFGLAKMIEGHLARLLPTAAASTAAPTAATAIATPATTGATATPEGAAHGV